MTGHAGVQAAATVGVHRESAPRLRNQATHRDKSCGKRQPSSCCEIIAHTHDYFVPHGTCTHSSVHALLFTFPMKECLGSTLSQSPSQFPSSTALPSTFRHCHLSPAPSATDRRSSAMVWNSTASLETSAIAVLATNGRGSRQQPVRRGADRGREGRRAGTCVLWA